MRIRHMVLAVQLAAAPVLAQVPGDPAAGRRLAEAQCSSCHVIGPGRSGPVLAGVPTFPDVARLPSTTPMALHAFMRQSHPNMPNIVLAPAQLDDVIAYILSLRRD